MASKNKVTGCKEKVLWYWIMYVRKVTKSIASIKSKVIRFLLPNKFCFLHKGYCPCCDREVSFIAYDSWLRDSFLCSKNDGYTSGSAGGITEFDRSENILKSPIREPLRAHEVRGFQ